MRVLLEVVVIGSLGWAAGRASYASREPASVAPPRCDAPIVVTRVAPPPAAEVVAPEPEADGEDVAAILEEARAARPAPPPAPEGNAIRGHVSDAHTQEPLVGVTVIAASPQLEGTQTAITDERGQYELVGLPAGSYTVTFYYLEIADEHDNVIVRALDPTSLPAQLDPSAAAPSFTGIESMENRYVIDEITVPDVQTWEPGSSDDSP